MGYAGPTGPKGLVWLGAFDPAALYQADDAVSYLGSSYIALRPTSSVAPGTEGGMFWSLLAAAGADGVAGPRWPGLRVPQELSDRPGRRASAAWTVCPGRRASPDRKALPGSRARRALLVRKGRRVPWDRKVRGA
jgi:hypothetical protein